MFAVRMERQWKSPSDQALTHHPLGRTRSAPSWVPITALFVSEIAGPWHHVLTHRLDFPPRNGRNFTIMKS